MCGIRSVSGSAILHAGPCCIEPDPRHQLSSLFCSHIPWYCSQGKYAQLQAVQYCVQDPVVLSLTPDTSCLFFSVHIRHGIVRRLSRVTFMSRRVSRQFELCLFYLFLSDGYKPDLPPRPPSISDEGTPLSPSTPESLTPGTPSTRPPLPSNVRYC